MTQYWVIFRLVIIFLPLGIAIIQNITYEKDNFNRSDDFIG
jgi:hypothetical protein